jgi:hypothetical protein
LSDKRANTKVNSILNILKFCNRWAIIQFLKNKKEAIIQDNINYSLEKKIRETPNVEMKSKSSILGVLSICGNSL